MTKKADTVFVTFVLIDRSTSMKTPRSHTATVGMIWSMHTHSGGLEVWWSHRSLLTRPSQSSLDSAGICLKATFKRHFSSAIDNIIIIIITASVTLLPEFETSSLTPRHIAVNIDTWLCVSVYGISIHISDMQIYALATASTDYRLRIESALFLHQKPQDTNITRFVSDSWAFLLNYKTVIRVMNINMI